MRIKGKSLPGSRPSRDWSQEMPQCAGGIRGSKVQTGDNEACLLQLRGELGLWQSEMELL